MESKWQEPVDSFLRELLNQLCFLTLCHSTQDLSSRGRASTWPSLVYTPTPWSGEDRIDHLT